MKGPSIKDALNGTFVKEEKAAIHEQPIIYSGKVFNEEFSKEQFRSKWFEYVQTLQNRPNLKAALSQVPELNEGLIIELTVANSVQRDMVMEMKPQIVSWLKSELKNSGIDLNIRIDETKSDKIIYTDTDKFTEMAKKNPALILLRHKFSLDFE
jgi:DNA polymerase-3 subunit gamma/tau